MISIDDRVVEKMAAGAADDRLQRAAGPVVDRRIAQPCRCAAAGDLLARVTSEHAGYVIGAESLADSHDARQNLARKYNRLCRGLELVE